MDTLRLAYHFCLSLLGAIYYRRPSKKIFVVGVTGTKGKTTTIEIINAILELAGYRTAISSTLRFKLGGQSEPNRQKMTMPGRIFLQRFLARAVAAGTDYALIEMTSEGARQHRQRFLELDALIFTNLAPEHLEAHGSYDQYREAKLKIAHQLARSSKPQKTIVVNGDDAAAEHFLAVQGPRQLIFKLADAEPIETTGGGTTFNLAGERVTTQLPGRFNLYNLLAAITFAQSQKIKTRLIKQAVEGFAGVRGRLETIGRQDFEVVVDYAHTPDSLRQVFEIFKQRKKICVLGSAGGGRDRWKRPVLGTIAAEHCRSIILTNEDPYDENPIEIVKQIAEGVGRQKPCQIIMDRRLAIRQAFTEA
ncbi:MAG: UDP-N-acetylmuramyl-tripeptide synthetase, partial [Candidatus Micrarchaeota archaeon]|nr:UDP-N-acetylmuramyl-tripeptide synthetase [Candidatus Micrarchaeota archaeon]